MFLKFFVHPINICHHTYQKNEGIYEEKKNLTYKFSHAVKYNSQNLQFELIDWKIDQIKDTEGFYFYLFFFLSLKRKNSFPL